MRLTKNSIWILAFALLAFFVSPLLVSADDTPPSAPSSPDHNEQTSYIYDLKKLVEKSKDNIKRVNEKIKEQAIYKRNQQREEKAREYYERAVKLFEEGKVDEARDLWEKSIRITEHLEMKGYIKESGKRFKLQEQAIRKEEDERMGRLAVDDKLRQQQVKEAYDKGVTLYKQKKFKAAKNEFVLVDQLMPDYKATKSYLGLLEQDIARQDQTDLKDQKKEIQHQQEEAEVARLREKEMWRKEIELKEQERQRKLTKQAADVYAQALAAYRKKDFVGAKEKFQEVEWVAPDYKATRKYLDNLGRDIKVQEEKFSQQKEKSRAQQEWEGEINRRKIDALQRKEFELKTREQKQKDAEEAEVYYKAAAQLMEDKKYSEARDKFLEVGKVYPDYKATATYLARLNKTLGIVETAPAKVGEEVKGIYEEAVHLYKDKDYTGAKFKFEQVEFMYPNYESTRRYLSKISKDYKVDASKDPADTSIEAFEKFQEGPPGKPLHSEEYSKLVEKAEPMYAQALTLYEEKKFDEALKQFQTVEDMLPNYKSTRPYIRRVNQQIKKVEQQRYKEEQTQQAETINVLAKQASTLYQKILQLSDDKTTMAAQKKFAFVDKLFANMSKEQAKLLVEIAEEEQKLRLEEIAYEQEVRKSDFVNAIDPIYQEAIRLYQKKDFEQAKAKFLEAQSKIADYRSSKRYLVLIDKQNQLLQQTMKDREDQIRTYEAKADENAKLQVKMELQAKDRKLIKELVGQAETVNEDIVRLSKDRDFEAIKVKFAELEKVVDHLLTIKGVIAKREKEAIPSDRKPPAVPTKSDASNDEEKNAPVVQKRTGPLSAAPAQSIEEHRRQQRESADQQIKIRKIEKQNKEIYHEAMRAFYEGRYDEAKVKFLLLEQNPRYADFAYKRIRSIDQILLKRQGKVLKEQDKKRGNYLKDRVERERVSFNILQANRDHERQSSRAKATSAGSVAPVYSSPREEYLNSLDLRARRPAVEQIADQNQVTQMKEHADQGVTAAEKAPESPSSAAEGVSPNEGASWFKRRKQKALSKERKKYFDEQYQAEQKKKAEEEQVRKVEEEQKRKAEEEQKQKVQEEQKQKAEEEQKRKADEEEKQKKSQAVPVPRKQSAQERRVAAVNAKILKRKEEREAKLRALYARELRAKDASFEQAIAAADTADQKMYQQDIKRQQELLRQQREEERAQRGEKERRISSFISQDKRAEERLQIKSPGSSDKNESAKPKEVSGADKETTRQQFESGVNELYREALSYYKSGMLQEAREIFSNVEDLSPNYKYTRDYIDRLDKTLPVNEATTLSKPSVGTASDRQDAVSQALDMFEGDASH